MSSFLAIVIIGIAITIVLDLIFGILNPCFKNWNRDEAYVLMMGVLIICSMILLALKCENIYKGTEKSSVSKTYDSLIYDEECEKFFEKNRTQMRAHAEMYASKLKISEQAKANFIEGFLKLQRKIIKDNPTYYPDRSEKIVFNRVDVENDISYKRFCEIAYLIKTASVDLNSQTINFAYKKRLPCPMHKDPNCIGAEHVNATLSIKIF